MWYFYYGGIWGSEAPEHVTAFEQIIKTFSWQYFHGYDGIHYL